MIQLRIDMWLETGDHGYDKKLYWNEDLQDYQLAPLCCHFIYVDKDATLTDVANQAKAYLAEFISDWEKDISPAVHWRNRANKPKLTPRVLDATQEADTLTAIENLKTGAQGVEWRLT